MREVTYLFSEITSNCGAPSTPALALIELGEAAKGPSEILFSRFHAACDILVLLSALDCLVVRRGRVMDLCGG